MYLTREEMKTQYQKAEKRKSEDISINNRFSVLTSKKKNSFQRLLSSTPWNKLADIYTAKSESVLRSPTLSLFVYFNLVYRCVLVCSSEARTLVYDRHTPNCHFYFLFLLNNDFPILPIAPVILPTMPFFNTLLVACTVLIPKVSSTNPIVSFTFFAPF